MLLSPGDLRKHVTTSLDDPALQVLLDAAEAAISRRLAAADAIVERLVPTQRVWPDDVRSTAFIYPARPVATVTSITETVGTIITTLASNDYRVWPGGYAIERLATGTNPRGAWTGTVDLTYAGVADIAERKRVQLGLVKLDLNHNPGLTSERIGDWQEDYALGTASYADEREAILATLGRGLVIA